MANDAKAKWLEQLKDVEHQDNAPVCLSPYGWTIKTIGGKKYVVANTLEEYSKLLESTGRAYDPEKLCVGGADAPCFPQNCNGCQPFSNGTSNWCLCT